VEQGKKMEQKDYKMVKQVSSGGIVRLAASGHCDWVGVGSQPSGENKQKKTKVTQINK